MNSIMDNLNLSSNKIIYTKEILKLIRDGQKDKSALFLTPLTKVEDLLNFSSRNLLFDLLQSTAEGKYDDFINRPRVEEIAQLVNSELGFELLEASPDMGKMLKMFFSLQGDSYLTSDMVMAFLRLLDRFTSKMVNVFLIGFDTTFAKVGESALKQINIHVCITSLTSGVIKWSNLESLVVVGQKEILEIHEREKLLAWLEMKSRTVLRLVDLENYFNGVENLNSYLINNAFKHI